MGKEQCIKLQEHIDDEQFIEQQEETVEKLADWFRTNKIPHSIGCCAMFRLMERILAQDIQSRDEVENLVKGLADTWVDSTLTRYDFYHSNLHLH